MQPRRLARSMTDRTFGGVCGGLAGYLGIDAWWVRGAFVAFTLFTLGLSLIIYFVLWISLPPQRLHDIPPNDPTRRGPASAETLILLGAATILLGMVVLAVSSGVLQGESGDLLLPFGLFGLGLVLLMRQLRRLPS